LCLSNYYTESLYYLVILDFGDLSQNDFILVCVFYGYFSYAYSNCVSA
jgi:hypothetical protein